MPVTPVTETTLTVTPNRTASDLPIVGTFLVGDGTIVGGNATSAGTLSPVSETLLTLTPGG